MSPRWLPLLLAPLLAACGPDPAVPEPGGVVVTASVDSTPTLSGPDVTFRVENRTGGPVYLARCGERIMSAVDRRTEGGWVEHSADACQAVLRMDPLRLDPGASAVSSQAVQLPGRYRLRIGVSSAPDEAPAWVTASPEFTVTT